MGGGSLETRQFSGAQPAFGLHTHYIYKRDTLLSLQGGGGGGGLLMGEGSEETYIGPLTG